MSALVLLILYLAALPLRAQEAPQQVVASLDDALLDVMKNAAALGTKGRFEHLLPVVERVYDLPHMAQLLVGPQWAQLTAAQQQGLISAFGRFSAANYAAQFDGYNGERFDITGQRTSSSGGTIVDTRLTPSEGQPVTLSYLMRQTREGWRIVDVLAEGTISELARRRSEFASVLRRDGPNGLIDLLEHKAAELVSR